MNFQIQIQAGQPLPELGRGIIPEKDWVTLPLGYLSHRSDLKFNCVCLPGRHPMESQKRFLLPRHIGKFICEARIYGACIFNMPAWLYNKMREELQPEGANP